MDLYGREGFFVTATFSVSRVRKRSSSSKENEKNPRVRIIRTTPGGIVFRKSRVRPRACGFLLFAIMSVWYTTLRTKQNSSCRLFVFFQLQYCRYVRVRSRADGVQLKHNNGCKNKANSAVSVCRRLKNCPLPRDNYSFFRFDSDRAEIEQYVYLHVLFVI